MNKQFKQLLETGYEYLSLHAYISPEGEAHYSFIVAPRNGEHLTFRANTPEECVIKAHAHIFSTNLPVDRYIDSIPTAVTPSLLSRFAALFKGTS